MKDTAIIDHVSIRPGISVLTVLAHLNYRPWFALAEFVDNSIQSFLTNRERLHELKQTKLRVTIDINTADSGGIVVRDNAAGIAATDFPRAFRPAELPPDRSGLGEFGMGMKSAACWFAPRWSVRTAALGEGTERSVSFDIDQIVRDSLDELEVKSRKSRIDDHFTEIVLRDPHRVPIGRTQSKIRSHLTDIYRIFVRDGVLELKFNGDELRYQQPDILQAPYYRDLNGTPRVWIQEFDFNFGGGLRAHGFAAIRRKASVSDAGFALFRRNRLIQGSGDEGYRPEYIFGKPNTFPYQRIFGEIHLEGFDVSHTKDGFQWDENEQPFLELLKEHISTDEMPLLQQAREYRVERSRDDFRRGAEQAARRTSDAISTYVPPVLSALNRNVEEHAPVTELPPAELAARRVIDVELSGKAWRIVLELSVDPAMGDWLELSDEVAKQEIAATGTERRVVGLRLSLVHPFMQRFCGTDAEEIEPLLRVAAALGLAEVAAREGGARKAGTIRRNVNELLRAALSHP
jgi:Histidine kinase-, DNA gyrase B-, and HSP90-like ATPase